MYETNKWIYENQDDNSCRYVLGTVGEKPLICFGINPSTAEPNKLDNTLRRVNKIALDNGYDSWIMLNLYPLRATNPNDLDFNLNSAICKTNFEHIAYTINYFKPTEVWAAWGTLIEKREYLKFCLTEIYGILAKNQCECISYGNNSKKGHPHHPLYLQTNCIRQQFNLKEYLTTL